MIHTISEAAFRFAIKGRKRWQAIAIDDLASLMGSYCDASEDPRPGPKELLDASGARLRLTTAIYGPKRWRSLARRSSASCSLLTLRVEVEPRRRGHKGEGGATGHRLLPSAMVWRADQADY